MCIVLHFFVFAKLSTNFNAFYTWHHPVQDSQSGNIGFLHRFPRLSSVSERYNLIFPFDQDRLEGTARGSSSSDQYSHGTLFPCFRNLVGLIFSAPRIAYQVAGQAIPLQPNPQLHRKPRCDVQSPAKPQHQH